MSAATTVRLRVRPERALTLRSGEGTTLHVAGDELELEAAEAEALSAQGFVDLDPAPAAGKRRSGAAKYDNELD